MRQWRINARPCNELSYLPNHFVTSALRSNLATTRSLTISRQPAAKESDIATFSEGLPSASTSLRGRETVKDATTAPQVALDEQLTIDQCVTAIEEWEIRKELSQHISHSPGVFSTTRNNVQKDIVAKTQDILSPICRLPVETLRHIFEEAVDIEAAEWFVNPTRRPTLLKAATRIAGTCRFWRTIAQKTPRMWNRLRVPIQVDRSLGQKDRTIGVGAFWGSLHLCGGTPLEVTIPDGHSTLEIPNLTSLNIDRLHLYDITQYDWSPHQRREPPSLPSPRHLWVGQGKLHEFSYTKRLPSFLISRTTTITAYNITIIIPEGSNRVTQLVLCGMQHLFRLTSLLKSLPCLVELDALGVFVKANYERGHSAFTHQRLRILRIHESCMYPLEHYLADGLQLPSLICFGVACRMRLMPWCYAPSFFPWVATQLPTTITHLEIHGEHLTSSTSNLIRTFYEIDTISTYGKAIGAVLCVLSQIRDMPEGEMSSGEESPPSTIRALHIHDYLGDGEDLYPALHQIYNNTNPIKVFFENCPNILPTVRREFMHA